MIIIEELFSFCIMSIGDKEDVRGSLRFENNVSFSQTIKEVKRKRLLNQESCHNNYKAFF